MAAIQELKCPYCGKSLSSEEHEHALEEFRLRVEEEHREQVDKEKEQYRRQREGLEAEIRKLKERNQAQLDSLSEKIRKESMDWCKEQIDCVKKMYNDLGIQRQREYEESLTQKTAELEQELYEKDRRFQQLQDDLQSLRLQAIEEAKAAVQAEKDIQLKRAEDDIDRERDRVREKDIQLKRAEDEADKLKKQLSQRQSELMGEVGELNLYDTVRKAFQQDIIERSSRGTACGDIIQQIRSPSGAILESTIVYDNKNAEVITSKDIEKAKGYMNTHATDHVIIVSKKLPKYVKNRYFDENEGVLLVHSDIIVTVAQQIRKGIINISKLSAGNQGQETKQSKIYNYIRSREFCKPIETISEGLQALVIQQDNEMKSHKTEWTKRRTFYDKLKDSIMNISCGIDAITQEQLLSIENENIQQSEGIENIANGDGNGKGYSYQDNLEEV